MIELLKYATSGFWIFCGCLVILSTFATVICYPIKIVFLMLNRTLRHKNILKHGYPPPHCDADGDLKEK